MLKPPPVVGMSIGSAVISTWKVSPWATDPGASIVTPVSRSLMAASPSGLGVRQVNAIAWYCGAGGWVVVVVVDVVVDVVVVEVVVVLVVVDVVVVDVVVVGWVVVVLEVVVVVLDGAVVVVVVVPPPVGGGAQAAPIPARLSATAVIAARGRTRLTYMDPPLAGSP